MVYTYTVYGNSLPLTPLNYCNLGFFSSRSET